MPGSNDRYRILVNKYGDVGWADIKDKKYQKINLIDMRVDMPRPSGGC